MNFEESEAKRTLAYEREVDEKFVSNFEEGLVNIAESIISNSKAGLPLSETTLWFLKEFINGGIEKYRNTKEKLEKGV